MDYKEKYEMALEGIQEIFSSGEDSIKMSRLQLRLQGIFPELKESEDEKIKKVVKDFVENYLFWGKNDLTKEKALAWLEKQGDQKSLTIDIKSMVDSYEQRLIKNGGVSNSPLVNMCVAAFKHGVENTLDELHLKQIPANSCKTYKDEPFDYENANIHQKDYAPKDETSIAINNPDAYRIGFADGEAHAKEERALAWSEEDNKHYESCLNYFEEIKPDSVFYKDYLWLKSLKQRIYDTK